jgi:bifunctional non-homologous end joining protein LigD
VARREIPDRGHDRVEHMLLEVLAAPMLDVVGEGGCEREVMQQWRGFCATCFPGSGAGKPPGSRGPGAFAAKTRQASTTARVIVGRAALEHRARRPTFPVMLRVSPPPPRSGFIEPCLPTTADRPPSGPDWIHEIKHDGYRLMARRDPVGIRLLTRNGNDWSPRYPLIVEAVNRLKVRSCLIDGEAVVCDDNGLAVFERLRRKCEGRHVFLFAFDLLELDGADLRREPIETRKATLTSLLRGSLPGLRLNAHFAQPGDVVFRHACKLGLEGIVSKRLGSRYRSGRSPDWLKFKNPEAPAMKREAEEDWER